MSVSVLSIVAEVVCDQCELAKLEVHTPLDPNKENRSNTFLVSAKEQVERVGWQVSQLEDG